LWRNILYEIWFAEERKISMHNNSMGILTAAENKQTNEQTNKQTNQTLPDSQECVKNEKNRNV
jgi:hypothetical protein